MSLFMAALRKHFYPRPPRGGRLFGVGNNGVVKIISIHALREEGDIRSKMESLRRCISIHALREEGDVDRKIALLRYVISIHALREEGDLF